jgi:hypothetical protein
MCFCIASPWFVQDTFAQSALIKTSSPSLETAATSDLAANTIKVSSIYKYGSSPNDGSAINDIIIMKVDNLKSYYHEQEKLCEKQNPICHPNFVLNLDGRKIVGISPESIVFEKEQGILRFHLRRDPENDEAWQDLLGSPSLTDFLTRNVQASISLENSVDSTPIATGGSFKLVRFRGWQVVFWIILLGVIALSLIFHVKDDLWNLIRESGLKPIDGRFRPYSLGRCQMALWLFVVIISYLSIYMTTGAADTLNSSVLILLGIGSGTALGAVSIDVATDSSKPQTSQGFWKDLLHNSESNGPGLHRLQLIIWTVILVVVFVVSVYSRLSMPQFSNILLALQGISSATYLGFKFPENSMATNSPSDPPLPKTATDSQKPK